MSVKLELTFNGEVLDGQVVFPVVGERLVKLGVFVILVFGFYIRLSHFYKLKITNNVLHHIKCIENYVVKSQSCPVIHIFHLSKEKVKPKISLKFRLKMKFFEIKDETVG